VAGLRTPTAFSDAHLADMVVDLIEIEDRRAAAAAGRSEGAAD
jgi:hypothetical protein